MRLKGKTAVITAAGAGIGRATAVAFAEQGARVIATDINTNSFAELQKLGIETSQLDVLDSSTLNSFAERYASVDILFNCAGYVHHGSILDCDEAAYDFSMNLNVKGNYQVTKAFLPNMLKRENTSIIFVASAVSSLIAAPNRFIYGASKAAMIRLSKSLAIQFASYNIRSNIILPGPIETGMQKRWKKNPKAKKNLEKFIPLQRVGKPKDISNACMFLLSGQANYITGTEIIVDGGITSKP